MRRLRIFALACLPLGGCALSPLAVVGTEATTYSMTSKTTLDSVLSAVSGYDCSVKNASIGRNYCSEPPKEEVEPERWCYRSLGEITCYDAALAGNPTNRVR